MFYSLACVDESAKLRNSKLLSGVRLSVDDCLVCFIPVIDSIVSWDMPEQDKRIEMIDRQMKTNLKQVTYMKSWSFGLETENILLSDRIRIKFRVG